MTVISNLDRTKICSIELILLETKREHFSLKFLWEKMSLVEGADSRSKRPPSFLTCAVPYKPTNMILVVKKVRASL